MAQIETHPLTCEENDYRCCEAHTCPPEYGCCVVCSEDDEECPECHGTYGHHRPEVCERWTTE
jgi:hypothetical protein